MTRHTWCCLYAWLLSLAVNASTQEWKYFEAPLQTGRHYFQALPIAYDKVIVMGGFINSSGPQNGIPTKTCEIIDLAQHRVYPAQPMNEGRAEFVALLTTDSNVIAISGVTGSITVAGGSGILTPTVELYDRTTNQWRIIGNLLFPRRQHTAIWLDDHRILVVGGRAEDLTTLSSAEIFDIRIGTSQPAPPYPYAMTDLVSARTSSGRIIVWGGRNGGPNSFRTNEVFEFTGVGWSVIQLLPEQYRAGTVLKLWDGRLLTTGGSYFESPTFNFVRSVYVENTPDIFSRLSDSLRFGRSSLGLAQWHSDSILVVGGFIGGLRTTVVTRTTEWIDLRNQRVSAGPTMIETRAHFQVVSLTNSKAYRAVLAISGLDTNNRNTPTIEVLMDGCISQPLAITGPTTLCDGDTVTLSASDGFAHYRWSTGQTSPRISVTKPGTYTLTATDSAGCSTSDSITIALLPSVRIRLLSASPRSAPLATLHCDTIEVTNPSSDTLWLDDIVLARNVEWSLPQHQRPLRLLPGQPHHLIVCWYATAHGSYRDTLCIVTPCGSACLPLLLETRSTQWRAISRCGVTVETPIEVADQGQSLLLQSSATVRVRDCLGRILLECPSDGQTASIPTASLLPGLYILDRDNSPALLLVR